MFSAITNTIYPQRKHSIGIIRFSSVLKEMKLISSFFEPSLLCQCDGFRCEQVVYSMKDTDFCQSDEKHRIHVHIQLISTPHVLSD